jgi:Protein of unknown function, DUF488
MATQPPRHASTPATTVTRGSSQLADGASLPLARGTAAPALDSNGAQSEEVGSLVSSSAGLAIVEPVSEASERTLISVGHSNKSIEQFLQLLGKQGIEVVADVRSHPYSRFAPHFNREPLTEALARTGLRYVFLGRELGGRPEGDQFYDDDGHVLYGRVAQTPLFLAGIERLERGLERFRLAMMCSEEDPTDCHRRLLVARVLNDRGINVAHLRGDGTVQPETALGGLAQGDIFNGFEEKAWRSTRSASHRSRPVSSSIS